MTITTGYSTRELQAAAGALLAGHFTTSNLADVADVGQVAGRRPAPATWRPLNPVLRVRAAHGGAGASTLALALADAAARSTTVHLVDASAPVWSRLAGASITELGERDGWRRGRRGPRLVIDRLDRPAATPTEVPVPRQHPCALTVLDIGWNPRELGRHPGWLTTAPATVDLVVTRADATALGQAETLLQTTDKPAQVLLILGARRWGGPEFTAASALLRELRDADAICFAPMLPRRALRRLGPEPLPRRLLTSAQRLLTRLDRDTDLMTGTRPAAEEQ